MLRKIIFVFLIIIFLLFAAIGGALVMLERPAGQRWLLEKLIACCAPVGEYVIGRLEGSPWKQWTFHDMSVAGVHGWPKDYLVKIQKLDLFFAEPRLKGLNIEVHNGRLLLPLSGAMVVNGIYQDESVDAEVYFIRADLEEILRLWPKRIPLNGIRGIIQDFSCTINGSRKSLDFKGGFLIEALTTLQFSVEKGVVHFQGSAEDIFGQPRVRGDVFIDKATLRLPQVVIKILGGKIVFADDPERPSFDLYGEAVVERTKIVIHLKGSADKPEIVLTSEPPMPHGQLLIMLATGRAWSGTETALKNGQVSADMAKDFLDYFIFGGSGNRLAQQLGIKDVSMHFGPEKRGVDLKKELSDKADLLYGIEQPVGAGTSGAGTASRGSMATQRVGAEFKVTPDLFVGGRKELVPRPTPGSTAPPAVANDEIFLKYNKKF